MRNAKLNRLLKLFNELVALPLAFFIYLVTPQLLRLIDPATGQYDTGQLAVIAFGVIKVIVSSLIAWVGYRLNFPKLYAYFISGMEQDFLESKDNATVSHFTEHTKISLLIYFIYMGLAIWAIQTV